MLYRSFFARRAKTAQAKAQVELAQYQYILPRLRGMWKHLERLGGGIGTRGPGESEIETDRRIVRDKISLLRKKRVCLSHLISESSDVKFSEHVFCLFFFVISHLSS